MHKLTIQEIKNLKVNEIIYFEDKYGLMHKIAVLSNNKKKLQIVAIYSDGKMFLDNSTIVIRDSKLIIKHWSSGIYEDLNGTFYNTNIPTNKYEYINA